MIECIIKIRWIFSLIVLQIVSALSSARASGMDSCLFVPRKEILTVFGSGEKLEDPTNIKGIPKGIRIGNCRNISGERDRGSDTWKALF